MEFVWLFLSIALMVAIAAVGAYVFFMFTQDIPAEPQAAHTYAYKPTKRRKQRMGLLDLVRRVPNHEKYDQFAMELATFTKHRVGELVNDGTDQAHATRQAISEVAMRLKDCLGRGMSAAGYARTMKSYEDAVVMLGLPRKTAKGIRLQIVRMVALP